MVIRRARAADLDAAGEVTVAAYAEFTTGPDDHYIALLRDAARRDREAELWVAARDDEVVGTVTVALPGSPWREIGGTTRGVRMLAVAPSARRRLGVGDALTQHVLDRFRGLGMRAVVLSSLSTMAAAHRIYERLGFRRAPERDWSPVPGVELVAFRVEL